MKSIKGFFVLTIMFLLSLHTMGLNYVWNPVVGSSPYAWSTGGNWTVGGVPQSAAPGAADDVTMTLTSGYTISIPATVSINSLIINMNSNSDVTLSLAANTILTATGNISIIGTGYTGKLTSGSFTFTMRATGATSLTTITGAKINFMLFNTSSLISYQNNTFSKSTFSTVTGATANTNNGGNTYTSDRNIVHTGTAAIYIAYTAPDTHTLPVSIDNRTGAGDINYGYTAGNVFKERVIFRSNTPSSINFGANANAGITLQDNAFFSAINTEFLLGQLVISSVTKNNPSYTSDMRTAAANANVIIGPKVSHAGDIIVKAGGVQLNGGSIPADRNAFLANVSVEKLFATSSSPSLGGNDITGTLTVINSSAADISMENSYNDNLSSDLYTAVKSTGNIIMASGFNLNLAGHLYIGSTGTGNSQFGKNGTNSKVIQASAKNILLYGSVGFTAGNVLIYGYTQTGLATAYTVTSTLNIPGNIIFGDIDVNDPLQVVIKTPLVWKANAINVNVGEYHNDITFESKVGNSNTNANFSNLHFYRNLTLKNSGNGTFYFGSYANNVTSATIDLNLTLTQVTPTSGIAGGINVGGYCMFTVKGDLIINQLASAANIEVGTAGSGVPCATKTVDLQGNIQLNKSGMGTGSVRFGIGSLVTHNGAKNIDAVTWNMGGEINFANFQQYGTGGISTVAVTCPVVGSVDDVAAKYCYVTLGAASIFRTPLTVSSSDILVYGGTYYAPVTLTKNNIANDLPATTGSVFDFKSSLTMNHYAGGTWALMNHVNDIGYFNGLVVLNTYVSGAALGFIYNGTGYVYNNLTCGTSYPLTIGTGGGIARFEQCNIQSVTSTPTLTIARFKINKSCNYIVMNANVQFTSYGDFTQGIVVIPKDGSGNSLYTLTFTNTAISQNQNILSFVDGTVFKTGTSGGAGFTFPIGRGTIYMPIKISELCSTTATVRATYIHGAQTNGSTLGTGIKDISNCNNWYVYQTSGTCSFSVTIPWSAQTCHLVNKDIMTTVLYTTSQWLNSGANALTGTDAAGTVTSNAATQFGYMTLGFTSVQILNTKNVYSSSFTIGTGADLHSATYTSGSSGTAPGTSTLIASQNNTPGIIVMHPDKLISCVQVNIAPTTYIDALNLCLPTDANGTVNGVTTAGNIVSTDYYSLTGNTILFYPNKKPDGTIAVVNNLYNGTIWKRASSPTLTFTIGGNAFTYVDLKIKSVATGSYVYTGSTLSCNGSGITTDGLYIYELSLGSVAGGSGATLYTGNVVVRMAE